MKITRDRLALALRYEAESGRFTWVNPPQNHAGLAGKEAGTVDNNGYLMIRIDGLKHKAHRLAWLYVYGEHPAGEIDHINGEKSDNRICNLRLASNPQNQANRRRNAGKPTPKGVRVLPSGNFNARIRVRGGLINLGVYKAADEASNAYLAAAKHHYGQFARKD